MTERARHCFYYQGDGKFLAGPAPAVEASEERVGAPEWVHIMPAPDADGIIHSRDYRSLRNVDLKKIAAKSNAELKRQRGGGPVDADHKIYGDFFTQGGGPVLGWAEEFEARDDGLYARTNWLPEGRKLIESQEYGYTSSVIDGPLEWEYDEDGWPTRAWIDPITVEGFGITNIPALKTVRMFTQGDDAMRIETMRVALAGLGLGEDASAGDIRAAFKRRNRFTSAEAEPATDVEPEAADVQDEQEPTEAPTSDEQPDDEGSPTTLRKKLATANARIAQLEKEQADSFIASLVEGGKLTPAQRKAAAALAAKPGGLAALKDLYAAAPRVIDEARPTALTKTEDGKAPPRGVSQKAWDLAADKETPLHELARRIPQETTT